MFRTIGNMKWQSQVYSNSNSQVAVQIYPNEWIRIDETKVAWVSRPRKSKQASDTFR